MGDKSASQSSMELYYVDFWTPPRFLNFRNLDKTGQREREREPEMERERSLPPNPLFMGETARSGRGPEGVSPQGN